MVGTRSGKNHSGEVMDIVTFDAESPQAPVEALQLDGIQPTAPKHEAPPPTESPKPKAQENSTPEPTSDETHRRKALKKAIALRRMEYAAASLALLEADLTDDEEEGSLRDEVLHDPLEAPLFRRAPAKDAHRHAQPAGAPQANAASAAQTQTPAAGAPQPRPQANAASAAPTQTPAAGAPQPDDSNQPWRDLTAALLEVARGGRPAAHRYPDLPYFSGNASEWLFYKDAFLESQAAFSEAENIARLRKSLKGLALEAVKGLFLGNILSKEIIEKLEARFGRPHALITSELDKLRNLPKLIDSPREVCIFASKVNNIICTIKALNKIEYLYNPEISNIVCDKLTTVVRNRWYDYEMWADDEEPRLLTMARFLDREAELNARHAKGEAVEEQKKHRVTQLTGSPCPICNASGHSPVTCFKFKSMSIAERWEAARNCKLCFRCLGKRTWQHRCKGKRCDARGCTYYHHKLLHSDNVGAAQQSQAGSSAPTAPRHQAQSGRASTDPRQQAQSGRASTEPRTQAESDDGARGQEAGASCANATIAATGAPRALQTFLKVLPVKVAGPHGELNTYALLDDGSTVTLLKSEVAQQIGAVGPAAPFYIEAIGGAQINALTSQRITFSIQGKYLGSRVNIEARTIDSLDISAQSVQAETLAYCEHLQDISEQLLYEAAEPTILIGQDNWALLVASEVRTGKPGQPVASLTPLGWVIHGQRRMHSTYMLNEFHRCTHARSADDSLEQLVREHFDLESLGVEPRRPQADPDTRALQILKKTTRALPEGGYETGLLWKEEGKPFPDNYHATLRRLEGVERRLQKDPILKQKYEEQICTLLDNKYAEISPTAPSIGRVWYLPHFPVLNPSKPGKVRIVHDAAAITDGVCLNDYLLTGPDLLQSLLGVLMRFRQKQVAVAADIKDMFLRIKIRKEDRDALRFLWRVEADVAPTEYRMTSLLFGATSSPTTAIYVKNENALLHKAEFPEAVNSIINNHYMDDYLQSFDTAAEANRVCHAVDVVHRRGNFLLQKWASNDSSAISGLAAGPAPPDININTTEKVLGLVWHTANDTLSFNLSKFTKQTHNITKRMLLKTAFTLYDPLGLVTPVTTQVKQILRETWRSNIGWDDPLPHKLEQEWQTWLVALQNLKMVTLPRCYPLYSSARRLELHVFVDASEVAYAAAAYWRSVNSTGEIQVSLAAAKGRVAPLKIVSIPRLELQAAVLGGRLACTVEREHERRVDCRMFWTDSRTVLAWLRAGARSFKPFVAHRVAELEETTDPSEWRWVPTAHNVADDATRRVPTNFTATHRWFRGPDFLYQQESLWPRDHDPLQPTQTGEERITTITTRPQLKEALPDVTRFSSWLRLIRSTARVLQYIQHCKTRAVIIAVRRKRAPCPSSSDPNWTGAKARPTPASRATSRREDRSACATNQYVPLAAHYTRRAENLWTRALQEECFPTELQDLTGGRNISTNSRLRHLSVIIDQCGILRLRPRATAASDIDMEALSPAILDGDHPYCRLYIDWVHRQLHHSGVECVTNEIRQRYWVLRLRPTVRTVIKRCQPCRLRRATPPEPRTGDLPPCRLAHHQRAFTQTGLDYFGPLSVTIARHHEKRYVALFTCLTTRAVHLEIAASLSADAAVLALRRMMARRGCPDTIWSDNGTNFHGADAELRRAALTSLQEEADIRHINWRYIPPGAPFMGGAWERLVRSVKTALTVTLHERHPHEDVLHTLLTEVEHTVNSRPLSHVSVAPEDDTALTPNHFLLGGPSKVPLPGVFTKEDELKRSHWRASQRLADLFWQRWVREVLPLLHHRREPQGHGEAVRVGDVVIVVDPTLPRNVWPMGRVERVFPGADGITRVADVKTKGGLMRRPTKRLVILPVEDN